MRIAAASTVNPPSPAPGRPSEPVTEHGQAPASESSVVRISDQGRSRLNAGDTPNDILSDPSAATRAKDMLYFDLVLRPSAEARLRDAASMAEAGTARQDWTSYVGRLKELIQAEGARTVNDKRLSAELSALLARFSGV